MDVMTQDMAAKALEAAPDPTVIIDAAGIICFSSRQTRTVFGYGAELIGKSVEVLLPERFRGRHAAHRQRYFETLRARPMGVGLELYAQRKDGTEFPVEISLSPLEGNGQVLVAAAIRDVTVRKRGESDLKFMEAIAETAFSSPSSDTLIRSLLAHLRTALHSDTTTILLLDSDGKHLIPYAYDGMEAEIGGEIRVPIGRGVAGRIAQGEEPVIFDDLSEVEVVSPVLRSRVRSLVGMQLKCDGHLVGVVHAGSSARGAFTQDHAKLLSLAAGRIGSAIERMRLQESERAAREAAETANRQKSSFLATASHDLRQPLQTLSLLSGALRRLVPKGAADVALNAQEEALDSMSRLLNALLDISKLESGAIKPDPTDFLVADIFEEMRREFASLAQNKGLDLQVARCQESVHSDQSLVGQILRNLVANAIKYTHKGCVTLRCLAQPSQVRLEVLDTGVGIPADKLQFIYDEFYQVGVPANSSRDGYGLGLSIVHRIARLLDVKMDVQSEPGRGSTFALTLPVGKVPAGSRGDIPQAKDPSTHVEGRVLLVEDDNSVRNATRLLLTSAGLKVAAAASLYEALDLASEGERWDVVVTDYHLQNGKTGLDVISSVRTVYKRPLKAILLTGDTSSMISQLSRDSSVAMASKPINAEHLLSILKSALAEAQGP